MSRVWVFLALLIVFSAPVYWLERTTGHPIYSMLDSWTPGAAALAAVALTGGRFSHLGWRGAAPGWWLAGWLGTIGVLTLAQLIGQLAGWAVFPAGGAFARAAAELGTSSTPVVAMGAAVLAAAVTGVLRFATSAVGEEIGWRGLLTPELAGRFGALPACAAVGLVWAVWHYPLFWPQQGAAEYVSFTVMVMGLAVFFGALRLRSGSIWPAVVGHAVFNAMSQKVFAAFWAPGPAGALGDRAIEVMIGLGCAGLGLALMPPAAGKSDDGEPAAP